MIIGSSILGGLGSNLAGGDFWQGFGQGIAVGAFNHVLHSANNGGGPGDPKYSKEVNTKISQMADATGLPIDIIMTSYEYGLKDVSTIISLMRKLKNIYDSLLFRILLSISLRSKPIVKNEAIIYGTIQIWVYLIAITYVSSFAIARYTDTVDIFFALMDQYKKLTYTVLVTGPICSYFLIKWYFNKYYEKLDEIKYPSIEYEEIIKDDRSFFDTLMVIIVILIWIVVLM